MGSSGRTHVVAVAVLAGGIALTLAGSGGAGEPNPRTATKPATVRVSSSAHAVLQRALAVFAPRLAEARYRAAARRPDPREATMLLRDVVVQLQRLSPADRRLARRIFARPTDGRRAEGPAGYPATLPATKRKHACTRRFCVHWVTGSTERPALTDRKPKNGRPDYIDKVIATEKAVWNKEVRAYGYRAPRSDSTSGSHHGGNPNRKIDIFVANIGPTAYGYCTTDDPARNKTVHRRTSAYCVVDNNFSKAEFKTGAHGIAALRVTLAHEFFHAIQFGYDLFEDGAFMEGTATWMEDQVFTAVNDNRQYLKRSPLSPTAPWRPLDYFEHGNTWQYGTWIWYRFLTEFYGAGRADAPIVIRRIWERAVGKASYSFKAVAAEINARSGPGGFKNMVALFGVWNAAPAKFYREGAGAGAGPAYPTAHPLADVGTLGAGTGPASPNWPMLHLANNYVVVRPSSTLLSTAKLTFSTLTAPVGATAAFSALVVRRNGSLQRVALTEGDSVTFDPERISKVVLVITNAGARFNCNHNTVLSCRGIPLDDYVSSNPAKLFHWQMDAAD